MMRWNVILSGGSGERSWPPPMPSYAKRPLRVFGGEDLDAWRKEAEARDGLANAR